MARGGFVSPEPKHTRVKRRSQTLRAAHQPPGLLPGQGVGGGVSLFHLLSLLFSACLAPAAGLSSQLCSPGLVQTVVWQDGSEDEHQ